MGEYLQLGKYPFLSQAKELLRTRGLERVGYGELEAAQHRVVESVKRAGAKDFPSPRPFSDAEAVVSYALGRFLLSLVGSDYYWQKFGRGEAALAAEYLNKESDDVLAQVTTEFFPSAKSEGGSYEIPLLQYLSYGWRLSQAHLASGVVHLEKSELLDLLRRAIARKAVEKTPLPKASELLKEAAAELEAMLPKPLEAATAFKGSYLSLPCIQSILAGVEEGKRYYASMALAAACRLDGLPKEKALEVMQQFVDNSRKQTHAFTMREATASLDWVYRRTSVRFHCESIRSHGLAPPECAFPCTHDRARRGK